MIFAKDPNAVLDYPIDWTSWLNGDTIASSSWDVPAGLTQVTSSATTTSATVWLSGGTAGNRYVVRCRITTAGGRTDDRSFTIVCKEK